MDNVIWKKQASAKTNGDFISITTFSGYRLALADPTVEDKLLPPDASDEILGTAVLEALSQSRHLTLAEAEALRTKIREYYNERVTRLIERYGYKTKQKLFKNMNNCDIESHNGAIVISPSNHEKLEGWSGDGIDKDAEVKLPANSSPAEVGVALRLAFSRCIG